MSSSTLALTTERLSWTERLCSYWELTKPRIAVLVLVVVAVSATAARWGVAQLADVLNAMLGTLLVAGSASAWNMWIERRRDARMTRTARRPLPSGRLSTTQVLAFGTATLILGMAYLAATVGWVAAGWAGASWAIYVCVYTPLKTRTPFNTVVGAVAGAMPVLIGWTAAGGTLNVASDPRGVALYLVVFLWQFPHFMAIAWVYRHQYAAAGMKMLSNVDDSGQRAGVQAVTGALALLPVSLVPAILAPANGAALYLIAACLAGLGQLAAALWFWRRPSDGAARLLLRATLVYLPCILFFLVLIPWI